MTDTEALLARARWPELAARLADWLPTRRWFQGKARRIAQARVHDAVALPGDPAVVDVLLTVTYERGSAERYQLPLTVGVRTDPELGTVAGLPLADALEAADSARTLATHLLSGRAHRSAAGAHVRGSPVGAPPVLPAAGRPLGVEQSNTSFVFGDALLLKVFRKVESGLNPEVELTRALTEEGFDHVPPQAGALLLEEADGPAALAVLSAFRAGSRDAWALALDEAAAARTGAPPPPLEGRAGDLGRVVAELHLALDRRFGGRPAGRDDVAAWAEAMRAQLADVRELAAAGSLAAATLDEHAGALRGRIERFRDLDEAGALIRTHGDLHLGQVLLDAEHGWQILDFEGEPARSLTERRLPHSPARDVAGMLRSFDYAAAHGADGDGAAGDPHPAMARWRDEGRRAFLAAYVERAGADGLLPRAGTAQRVLLDAFELEKAVYEVGYELANRPGWVGIPLAGILRLVAHGSVPSAIER